MTKAQRNAVRKRMALERAVAALRVRFDELQRTCPNLDEYTRLIVRSALGNRHAAAQLRAIERARRRYEAQQKRVRELLAATEHAFAALRPAGVNTSV